MTRTLHLVPYVPLVLKAVGHGNNIVLYGYYSILDNRLRYVFYYYILFLFYYILIYFLLLDQLLHYKNYLEP